MHRAVILIDSGGVEPDRVGAAGLHRAAREARGPPRPHRAHAVPGISTRIRIPRPGRRPADRDGIDGRIPAAVVSTRELDGSADRNRSDRPPPPPAATTTGARAIAAAAATRQRGKCDQSDYRAVDAHGILLNLLVCG